MDEKIKSFKDLRIWKFGIEIVKEVYRLTRKFPSCELYNLTSQIRRSAISLPSNIAEGFKRWHNKEYKHFLYITLGSAAELETQLIIANQLDYIDSQELNKLCTKIDILSKMTTVLIKKLSNK